MLSLRSLAATALRGLRGDRPPHPHDPDAEEDLPAEELEALRRELAGELERVATPSGVTSR